jgi:hypothetical protein
LNHSVIVITFILAQSLPIFHNTLRFLKENLLQNTCQIIVKILIDVLHEITTSFGQEIDCNLIGFRQQQHRFGKMFPQNQC